MRKIFQGLFLIASATVLFACEGTVKVIDGRLPEEYISVAQAFTGDYHGYVEDRATTLSFKMDRDKPVLSSSRDLVGLGCLSRIGRLLQFRYEKGDPIRIKEAHFDFNPGLCNSIEGRILHVDMDFSEHKDTIHVEYLDHYEWRWEYVPGCDNPFDHECRPHKDWVRYAIIRTGDFARVK